MRIIPYKHLTGACRVSSRVTPPFSWQRYVDTLTQLRAGQLAGIQRLSLSAGLTQIPDEVYGLADSLEILDLSNNALRDLPQDLTRLTKLKVIFLSNNAFEHVPDVLGTMPSLTMVGFKANRIRHLPAASLPPHLRWLILTDNDLDTLPDSLGQCTDMQKLMLAGNRLSALPDSMAACHKLELLRIAANRFESLPDWLFDLPRLSWLAYAGNPCCQMDDAAVAAQARVGAVSWNRLALKQILGQGASGVIHQADLMADTGSHDSAAAMPRNVSVKIYKGAVTSDGSPESEMAACVAAGAHPHLIPLEATLADHPAGTPGLVMSLIDPGFTDLAGPPSLASCTRDVYAPGTVFSVETARRIAAGIASAAAHLHALGIMHGDLYGHNILRNTQGDSLLGDFGAASFYALGDAQRATALQRLEVRAFGCLLEELIAQVDPEAAAPGDKQASSRLARMIALRDACLSPVPTQRPLFPEIAAALAE